jgi:cytochrome c-type biogenesis protein CcmH
MRLIRHLALVVAASLCLGAASEPSERLADPVQEARAKALFSQVRCVVCQNESIDDSQADLAADLRKIVRTEVAQGRNDRQIKAYLVARYGEFILLKPAFSWGNAALWLVPFAIVGLGGLALLIQARRSIARRHDGQMARSDQALNASEQEKLARILRRDEG